MTTQIYFTIVFVLSCFTSIYAGDCDVSSGHCYFILYNTSFQDAIDTCAYQGAYIVTINSYDENTFLLNTYGYLSSYGYIGLNDRENFDEFVWAGNDTSSYTYFDTDEPDDIDNLNGGQYADCVVFDFASGFWVDVACEGHEIYAICEYTQTRTPTLSPTVHPTKQPTNLPTGTPSQKPVYYYPPTSLPSSVPSSSPTTQPSRNPTQHPTLQPTSTPTTTPTTLPTLSPTPVPTSKPTASPTSSPTSVPTKFPTVPPTSSPTPGPTPFPTTSPTSSPTPVPTLNPTASPTSSPSPSPTPNPTASPTLHPTPVPTSNPTVTPTSSPTPSPTSNPTVSPTPSPTNFPTLYPTVSPTSSPTPSPTSNPTVSPTSSPTIVPTPNPTVSPTSSPTNFPTPYPTASPTSSPTPNPTSNPTVSPTSSPTPNPTSNPTVSPTPSPTPSPTSNPTVSPTSSPTIVPTPNPTASPTSSPTNFPTLYPTASPTSSPTPSPTSNPTVPPTSSPTPNPTSNPTVSPTSSPTNFPTPYPTASPTSSPTPSPTSNPTVSPTSSPTNFPTPYPTASPTSSPTPSPTPNPTASPTSSPTNFPIPIPTVSPTSSPTNFPTLYPTASPTSSPTNFPTLYPTASPTSSPTNFPTLYPTASPTSSPTPSPTSNPTVPPTSSPTSYPTEYPSLLPTQEPSLDPTPSERPAVTSIPTPGIGETATPTSVGSSTPTIVVTPGIGETSTPTSVGSFVPTVDNGETVTPTVVVVSHVPTPGIGETATPTSVGSSTPTIVVSSHVPTPGIGETSTPTSVGSFVPTVDNGETVNPTVVVVSHVPTPGIGETATPTSVGSSTPTIVVSSHVPTPGIGETSTPTSVGSFVPTVDNGETVNPTVVVSSHAPTSEIGETSTPTSVGSFVPTVDNGETVNPTVVVSSHAPTSEIGETSAPTSVGSFVPTVDNGETVNPTVVVSSHVPTLAGGDTAEPTGFSPTRTLHPSSVDPKSETPSSSPSLPCPTPDFHCKYRNMSVFSDSMSSFDYDLFYTTRDSTSVTSIANPEQFFWTVDDDDFVPFDVEYYAIEAWGLLDITNNQGSNTHTSVCFHASCTNEAIVSAITRSLIENTYETFNCGNCTWRTDYGKLYTTCGHFNCPCSIEQPHNYFAVSNNWGYWKCQQGDGAVVVDRGSVLGFKLREKVAPTVPVLKSVTGPCCGNVVTTYTTVNVTVSVSTYGGLVYCGAFSSANVISSVSVISQQGHYGVIPSADEVSLSTITISVEVGLRHLVANASSSVACYCEDTIGNPSSLDDAINKAIIVVPSYCNDADLRPPPSGYGLSSLQDYYTLEAYELSYYTLTLALGSSPTETVITSLVFYDFGTLNRRDDVFVYNNLTFTSADEGDDLIGTFVVYGAVGHFDISVVYFGPSAYEFCAYHNALPSIRIVSEISAAPSLLPSLNGTAYFTESGLRVVVSFSRPTDYAATVVSTDSWKCSLVFSFTGANGTECQWRNSSTVVIALNSHHSSTENILSPGDTIMLRPNVVKGFCFSGSCVSAPFAPSSATIVAVPSIHVNARAVLVGPTSVLNCEDLVIDPTLSSGHGLRPWKTIRWRVFSGDGSDVSEIRNYLTSITSTDVPVVIPSHMLHNTTYFISLGLRNFMQENSDSLVYSSVEVSVLLDQPVLTVSISSARKVSVQLSSFLYLSAQIAMTDCANTNTGNNSMDYTYKWTVYKNYVVDRTVTSTYPLNPSVFTCPGSSFSLGSTYQVVLAVTATSGSQSWTSYDKVFVESVQTSVRAIISGGLTTVSSPHNAPLMLDGSESLGSALSYAWSCRIASVTNFGANCLSILGISSSEASASALSIAASILSAGVRYRFTLTVSGAYASTKTIHSASVLVICPSVSPVSTIKINSPLPVYPFNPLEQFKFYASVTSQFSEGANCTWSLHSARSELEATGTAASIAPVRRFFSYSQLTNGVDFPLGLNPGSLTAGVEYTFRLTVEQLGMPSAYIDIRMNGNTAPTGGNFSVSPSSGYSYSTEFRMIANSWVDDATDYPLRYQFVYQIGASFDWSKTFSRANSRSTLAYTSTTLPYGEPSEHDTITAAVICIDVWGAEATSYFLVTVSPTSRRRLSSDPLSALSVALKSNRVHDLLEIYQEAVNVINDVARADCSAAPDCSALNREPCVGTSHTCGSCLSGYAGVYGDSNYHCHEISYPAHSAGYECNSDSECFLGYCDGGVCVPPPKPCPAGGHDGSSCSGHGVCSYMYVNGEPSASRECTVDKSTCHSYCLCDDGYGGRDCSFTEIELSEISNARGNMCEYLVDIAEKDAFIDETFSAIVSYLLQVYDPSAVVSIADMSKCESALRYVTGVLSGSSDGNIDAYTHMAGAISEFAQSSSFLVSDSVYNALDALEAAVLDGMIAGQQPVEFLVDSFRVSYLYINLEDLSLLSAPRTEKEIHYSSPQYSMSLPANGLEMCEAFDDYAKVAVLLWNVNPQNMDDSDVDSRFFTVATYATSVSSNDSTLAVDKPDHHYELTLQLDSTINTSLVEPLCKEYSFSTNILSDCTSCIISNYEATGATITCYDAVDYFCPSVQGGSVLGAAVRRLQAANDKAYTLSLSTIMEPSTQSFDTDNVTQSTALLSFTSAWLFVTIFSFWGLYIWDKRDKEVLGAQEADKEGYLSSDFNLTAAFDKSGRGCDTQVNLVGISRQSFEFAISPRNRAAKNEPIERASSFRYSAIFHRSSTFAGRQEPKRRPAKKLSVAERASSFRHSAIFPRSSLFVETSTMSKTGTADAHRVKPLSPIPQSPSYKYIIGDENNPDYQQTGSHKQFNEPEDPVMRVWAAFPSTSFLSERDWWICIYDAVCRNHKWARIFSYSSLRLPRNIRFLVAATDLLFIMFTLTVFYSLYYPDDNRCEDLSGTTEARCLSLSSNFESNESLCSWSNDGRCEMKEIKLDLVFIVLVTLIAVAFSVIPRDMINAILVKICAKRPCLQNMSWSGIFLFSEPRETECANGNTGVAPNSEVMSLDICNFTMEGKVGGIFQIEPKLYDLAHSDFMNPYEEVALILSSVCSEIPNIENTTIEKQAMVTTASEMLSLTDVGNPRPLSIRQKILYGSHNGLNIWKCKKARSECTSLVHTATSPSHVEPGHPEYADMVLLQNFVLEQLSSICRFAYRRHIYEMDDCSPGRVNIIPWVASWLLVFGMWVFMGFWVISWTLTHAAEPAKAWALSFGVVVLVDIIMNSLTQIFLLDVYMAHVLRPQLRDIFCILNEALHLRLLKRVSPCDGVRIVQHFSASCRASRNAALKGHKSAILLSIMDDVDVALCRRNRVESIQDVGYVAYLMLYVPSLLNTIGVDYQQAVLDMTLPIIWCCFIWLNYIVSKFSVYILVALYFLLASLIVVYVYVYMRWKRGEEFHISSDLETQIENENTDRPPVNESSIEMNVTSIGEEKSDEGSRSSGSEHEGASASKPTCMDSAVVVIGTQDENESGLLLGTSDDVGEHIEDTSGLFVQSEDVGVILPRSDISAVDISVSNSEGLEASHKFGDWNQVLGTDSFGDDGDRLHWWTGDEEK